MTADPRRTILESRMGRRQTAAVALCIFLNALDGFDVLAISFASPGIAREWGIDRAALGIVLSMELIGMGVGALLLGKAADRFGRRRTILACLLLMAAGMFLASTARSVPALSAWRLLTGLGIGGMLASINAAVSEVANGRRRSLAVGLMTTGYPMGAVVGGSIASVLLATYDWRSVFLLGGVATAACVPLVLWLLPESIDYLVSRRPKNALARVNATLTSFGHSQVAALPALPAASARIPAASLWGPGLTNVTLLLTLGYFAHIMTFYFMAKWIPKIVVDMGHAAASAGGVLVWANVGGATGALLFSILTTRAELRRLSVGFLLLSTGAVVFFGQAGDDLDNLALVSALVGFFANGGIVGFYALVARSYPADLRASGTGFVIGVGRAGAALGPILAGFLFVAGWDLPTVALAMAAGSLTGAVALLLLAPPREIAKPQA